MREDEIKETIREETDRRIKEVKQLLDSKYKENTQRYIEDFKNVLERALTEMFNRQKKIDVGQVLKGSLKYIYANCMRTRIETGEYSYVIRLLDKREFRDNEMVEESYTPKYIKELIETDKEYFEKLIMKKVIRAKKYEVKDFMREYIWNVYIKPIPREMQEVLSRIDDLEGYNKIEKEKEVRVGYGEFLEKLDEEWLFTTKEECNKMEVER